MLLHSCSLKVCGKGSPQVRPRATLGIALSAMLGFPNLGGVGGGYSSQKRARLVLLKLQRGGVLVLMLPETNPGTVSNFKPFGDALGTGPLLLRRQTQWYGALPRHTKTLRFEPSNLPWCQSPPMHSIHAPPGQVFYIRSPSHQGQRFLLLRNHQPNSMALVRQVEKANHGLLYRH